jgi:hypothetical protein
MQILRIWSRNVICIIGDPYLRIYICKICKFERDHAKLISSPFYFVSDKNHHTLVCISYALFL